VSSGYSETVYTMSRYGSGLRQVIVCIYIPWPGMVQGWDRLLYVFTYHGRVWFRVETGHCMYLHTMAGYGSGLRQVIVCIYIPWPGMVQGWDRLLYVFTYHGWVWFWIETGIHGEGFSVLGLQYCVVVGIRLYKQAVPLANLLEEQCVWAFLAVQRSTLYVETTLLEMYSSWYIDISLIKPG